MGRSLPCTAPAAWLALALAACDTSRTPLAEPEPTATIPAQENAAACRLGEPVLLPDSEGHGPVAATRSADDGVVVAYDATRADGPGLVVAELSAADLAVRASQWIPAQSAGPLLAEAIAFDASGLAVAARQSGGRRAYFFSGLPGTPLRQVDAPTLGALDRRVAVRLAGSSAQSGIQVVTWVSGASTLDVGRLAGSLLATQPHDWAGLLLPPEAALSARGEALLAGLRTDPATGGRALELRVLAADGSAATTHTVAPVEADARVEQMALIEGSQGYELWWLIRAGERAELRRAAVELATGAVTPGLSLRPDADEPQPNGFAAARRQGVSWIAWTGAGPSGPELVLVGVDDAGVPVARHRLDGERDGGTWSSPQLVALGDGLGLVWRELTGPGMPGPVRMSWLSCR